MDINDGRLEIHEYVYYDGKRIWLENGQEISHMLNAEIGERYRVKIRRRNWRRKWEIEVDGIKRERPAPFCPSPMQVRLRFYFGGNEPAKQKTTLKIKKLKGF